MTEPTPTLERRMARSAAWMVGLRLADRAVGLVSILFLARLLTPADFGLVAMGTVVLGALEAVTGFGFEMALIKRQAKDRPRWDSAWTMNVIVGLANAAVIAALAPAAATFYDEPRVVQVMFVLSAIAVVSGLRNIGMVEFEQRLQFGPIVALALTRRTGSFLITLALAWTYGTYWSLLVGMLTGQVIDLLLSYVLSRYRPRLSLAAWRDLFSFSKWLLINNFLGYASLRGGDAIVGGRAGAAVLGVYSMSFELANLPTTEMVKPVMRAVFPAYAMMAGDPRRLAASFVTVFSLVLLFALPAAAGIALLAEPTVAVLLGPKWDAAVPMLQVLALYGGVRAAQANTGSVYMALDRPQLAAAMTFLNIVLAFGTFAVALGQMPVAQAARYLVVGSVLAAIVNLTLLKRLLVLGWTDLLGALARPAIGIAVMSAALWILAPPLWNGGRPLLAGGIVLIVLIAAGALVYLATVLLLWRLRGRPSGTPEHAIVGTLATLLRRRSPA